MERTALLNKLKGANPGTNTFSIVIGTWNDHDSDEIVKSAKWLESEMYIRLNECVRQDDGVRLSGKIEEL